jgi:hypothetical protein
MKTTAFVGRYPVSGNFQWHNGLHLQAPVASNGKYLSACAIADGTIVHAETTMKAPNTDVDDAQNFPVRGSGPEWSDNGIVIIKHTLPIGRRDDEKKTQIDLEFFSVYMHLKSLSKGVAKDKPIKRNAILGECGKIYNEPAELHFEICMNKDNLKELLGKTPDEHKHSPSIPSADGRSDSVFGNTYIYLPADTPTSRTAPSSHTRQLEPATRLAQAQWVEISYAGDATLRSYTSEGAPIGNSVEPHGEWRLSIEAEKRHNSLKDAGLASSANGWYQLLRFGRRLNLAVALADNAAHWREVVTPEGLRWVDLNAANTRKLSGADFPAIAGWMCIDDDTEHNDQRCDSKVLKHMVCSVLTDAAHFTAAYNSPDTMDDLLDRPTVRQQMRRMICKFPSEFDRTTYKERYGWMLAAFYQGDPEAKGWKSLCEHIEALTFKELPDEYTKADWHIHPVEFVALMRSFAVSADVVQRWDTACDTHELPSETGLNDFEKTALYEYGLRSAIGATRNHEGQENFAAWQQLERGDDVIFGMRVETDINANAGKGLWDDRVTILRKDESGLVSLYFNGPFTTEPSGMYLDGGPHKTSNNGGGKMAGGTQHVDSGRLIANRTYEYKPGHSNGRGDAILNTTFNVLKKTASSNTERLVTLSTAPLQPNTYITSENAHWITGTTNAFKEDMTMHFHKGYSSMTGSAGCQTFPITSGQTFLDFAKNLKSFISSTRYQYTLKKM